MSRPSPAFGIDFGTTNTRVAHFDGDRVRMVPFTHRQQTVYQLPTAIAYRDGAPAAFGFEAVRPAEPLIRFPPLKWALAGDREADVGGRAGDPQEATTAFLRNLKKVVGKGLPGVPLDRAAVTIPVHYPPAARRRLHAAFGDAGIEVTHFYFEPIAAIYAGLVGTPASGVSAVFDWGGGSLDVAAVEVREGLARTREVDGWHRGGTDFDWAVGELAANDFLARHSADARLTGLTAEHVLRRTPDGRRLLEEATLAKEGLAQTASESLTAERFLGVGPLLYTLKQAAFGDLIRSDVNNGLARLARVLGASGGVTPATLARLFLSGGTCKVRDVRERLAGEYASRLVAQLSLPARLRHPSAGGLTDISNATAVGAALLAGQGAAATFAASVGVRLAGGEGEGRFLPVFLQGEPVRFDRTEEVRLFVTNTSGGVARLLVCEQTDDVTQPAGRLLKVITVPVVRSESWVRVGFRIDRHLTLQVRAVGVKNFQQDPTMQTPARNFTDDWVQSLKLGFQLPAA